MIGTIVGPYEFVAKLGEGGMGEVYRARDTRLGRDVAIKVLPASLSRDPIARERLRREAVAAAGLDHPFVCKVFEIGDADGQLFIVMEHVVGDTLHARLSAGAVSLPDALAWAVEIAEALETAHARRIVHRDLKPSNVMVASQGHIKVMDFGLAKDVSVDGDGVTKTVAGDLAGPLTDRGARVGTPGYMAPEQIVGDVVDGRADIFALGVLLSEAVSGVHPFRRQTLAATASAILGEEPLMAGPQASDVPAPVRQILQRMLAKAPGDRYQSMADVRRDLIGLSSSAAGWSQLGGGRWASADRIGQTRRWPMVGRDAERADLIAMLDRALDGRGGMVLLGGEPGIGKTRLTEAMLDEGRARGCMSLVGHAYEMEGAPPYVPFIEMLEYSTRVVPPAALRHALGDAAPEVAKLMPELRQMFPDIPPALDVPAEQQRRLLFNGYRDFVERSCRMAPIVTVLEDLHWADDSTLQLLLHLAPAMASWPILVVGTYRDVELDVNRPFAKVLETLVRQRLATRMTLRRLPAEGVSALLSAMSGGLTAPPSLSRIVFNETEGNPFFVEEVFQHLKEEGRLFDEAGQWRTDMRVETLDVPEGVRLVIGRRLERLSDQSRRVLTTAAVIGRSFSLALLESIEGPGREDDVLVAIEEAEQAHLIAAQRAGRETRYLFAHELIRQTLADALSMPRRQRLHGKIADAIERVYSAALDKHASAMAHHLYQAGAAADPAKTTKYLVAASDEARASNAPEDALRCLDQALSLWDDETGPLVADLHDRRGRVFRSLSRPDDAIAALSRALALWDPRRDTSQLIATAVELCLTHVWQADAVAAARVTGEALARAAHVDPVQRIPLELIHAASLAVAGEAAKAVDAFEAADRARVLAGVPALDLLALPIEIHVRWCTMDIERAGALSRRAAPRLAEAGLLWQAADIEWVALFCDYFLGRPVPFAEIDAVVERARRVGHSAPVGVLENLRSYLQAQQGDLSAATHTARQTVSFNRSVDNRWGFFTTLFEGYLELLQGRAETGLPIIAQAEADEPVSYWMDNIRALRLWALANTAPEQALALWERFPIAPPDLDVMQPFGIWSRLGPVVLALATLGRRSEAAAFLPACEAMAGKSLIRGAWAGSPPTTLGVAAACAERWDIAEAAFHRAMHDAAAMPMRAEESHARIWYADMLRHRNHAGDRDRARVLCDEAESLAATLGAVFLVDRARAMRQTL